MTTKSNTLFKKLAATFVLAATTAALYAADATGTWTWSTPGRNGGPDRVSTLTLKADGANLTGKVSVPGRDGAATDTQIADGKVDGDKISGSITAGPPPTLTRAPSRQTRSPAKSAPCAMARRNHAIGRPSASPRRRKRINNQRIR